VNSFHPSPWVLAKYVAARVSLYYTYTHHVACPIRIQVFAFLRSYTSSLDRPTALEDPWISIKDLSGCLNVGVLNERSPQYTLAFQATVSSVLSFAHRNCASSPQRGVYISSDQVV
jgi:hypothetical protein